MVIRVRDIEIDSKARTIAHAERTLCVGRGHRRWRLLVSLICGGGLSNSELVNLLYSEDMDGGPLAAEELVRVMLTQVKKHISKIQLRLVSTRSNESNNRYEIIPASMNRGSR